jgi:hypothetical protein
MIGDVVILMGILMYKSSFSPLFVMILGVRGVLHGMTVMVTGIHLRVVKRSMFGVPAIYMGITMAQANP